LRRVFVDSGAWLAVYDKSDQYHKSAIALWRDLSSQPIRLFTSDYVLDETYTLLKLRVGLQAAIALHGMLDASRIVTVAEVTGTI
jgi:hypothetical protein